MPKPYHALLFDLNGTLVDDNLLVLESIQAAVKQLSGIELPIKILRKGFGSKMSDYWQSLLSAQKLNLDTTELAAVQHEYYWKNRSVIHQLKPTTQKMLEKLKPDYRLGIVTNASRTTLEATLNAEELSLFDVTITSKDITRPKPHPEPFLRAAKVLDILPAFCLAIGDGVHDVESAVLAQMDMVGVNGGIYASTVLREKGAKAFLESIDELESFLKKG